MVSTRRKTAAPAADEAPQAAPRRGASPRRPRRAAAPPQAGAAAAPPAGNEATWVAHYSEMAAREREAIDRNAFTRGTTSVRRAWHYYRTTMGMYMMDPWEEVLYNGGILLVFLAAVHALGRLVDLVAPAVAGWAAAAKLLLKSS